MEEKDEFAESFVNGVMFSLVAVDGVGFGLGLISVEVFVILWLLLAVTVTRTFYIMWTKD